MFLEMVDLSCKMGWMIGFCEICEGFVFKGGFLGVLEVKDRGSGSKHEWRESLYSSGKIRAQKPKYAKLEA